MGEGVRPGTARPAGRLSGLGRGEQPLRDVRDLLEAEARLPSHTLCVRRVPPAGPQEPQAAGVGPGGGGWVQPVAGGGRRCPAAVTRR
ncbi:hypothetical protein GCM10009731_63080 [Streptomyces globosus]